MIETLRTKYPVKSLCTIMSVNPSGYYKWRKRKDTLNRYESKRVSLTMLIKKVHEKYKSYGYHRIAAVIRKQIHLSFSDNLIHKCCKHEGIQSKAKHYKCRKTGKENVLYPNRILNQWSAGRPLDIVASDMTCIKHKGKRYEWTYMLDTYNNEIISSHLSSQYGDRRPYFHCLEDLKEKIKEQTAPVVLHTDQGAVYTSKAFFNAHKDYNIIRSMSRVDRKSVV